MPLLCCNETWQKPVAGVGAPATTTTRVSEIRFEDRIDLQALRQRLKAHLFGAIGMHPAYEVAVQGTIPTLRVEQLVMRAAFYDSTVL